MCNDYRDGERFRGLPELVTFFSGDAFNPSLESSVTKGICFQMMGLKGLLRDFWAGSHMVPVLNTIGTDVACVGVRSL